MMISVQGTFQNGVAQPIEPVAGREGQKVIITFLEDTVTTTATEDASGWDQLMQIIHENTVDISIKVL